jgi:hypothetical protein
MSQIQQHNLNPFFHFETSLPWNHHPHDHAIIGYHKCVGGNAAIATNQDGCLVIPFSIKGDHMITLFFVLHLHMEFGV